MGENIINGQFIKDGNENVNNDMKKCSTILEM